MLQNPMVQQMMTNLAARFATVSKGFESENRVEAIWDCRREIPNRHERLPKPISGEQPADDATDGSEQPNAAGRSGRFEHKGQLQSHSFVV